ncbi:MAG: hypothetical protein NT062_38400, partial [Proteobacteria bacterium]|nr:hypothetical protein [Pseudomonadota bacterium]
MRNLTAALAIMLVTMGCGKKANTTPDDGEEHQAPIGVGSGEQYANDPNQVPAEKIEETNRLLARKQNVVARCLSIAVDNKELPKNTRGKVTLDIVVGRDGTAKTIKVAHTTIESKSLEACVIEQVQKIG